MCRRFQVSANHLFMGDNSTRSLQDFVVIGCLGVCFNLILVDVPVVFGVFLILFLLLLLFFVCLFVLFCFVFSNAHILLFYFLLADACVS